MCHLIKFSHIGNMKNKKHNISMGTEQAYVYFTFYVLEESLWRKQREAHWLQHLHYVLFPLCHVLKNPVHSCSENLIFILNSELLTSQQSHQLILQQALELICGTYLQGDNERQSFVITPIWSDT